MVAERQTASLPCPAAALDLYQPMAIGAVFFATALLVMFGRDGMFSGHCWPTACCFTRRIVSEKAPSPAAATVF